MRFQQKNEHQSFNANKGIGIPFYWEWKRPKYNCQRGFGICNFSIGKPKIVPEQTSYSISSDSLTALKTTYLKFDNRGACYVELHIEGTESFDDTEKNLYVDEDVCVWGSDSLFYQINQGVYPLDSLIGNFGGYIIPIQRFSTDNP